VRLNLALQIQMQIQRRPAEAGRYKVKGKSKVNDARLKSRRPLQIQEHGAT
jgi:hypothetical protein